LLLADHFVAFDRFKHLVGERLVERAFLLKANLEFVSEFGQEQPCDLLSCVDLGRGVGILIEGVVSGVHLNLFK
jgi:hypothetical protein